MSRTNLVTNGADFGTALSRALDRRRVLIGRSDSQAFRVFSGEADGIDGVYIDVYAAGAALIVYEGRAPQWFDPTTHAAVVLELLRPLGVRAVYLKPFAKDRSRLGGNLPACVTDAKPAAGEPLPDAILVREASWNLEIRLFDGLSTGLFLDQRENRSFTNQWVAERAQSRGAAPAILNTFAYTCGFSIAAACAGAVTTSVDVSGRYLDWGKRNFAHNQLDISQHRFTKFDTFEFFAFARRKALRFDLVILDPPSFASGSKKKGIRAWSSVSDYARLVREAAGLLHPRGTILASTNTQELCLPGRLEREIIEGLGHTPRWVKLPPAAADFSQERGRFAARAFEP
jgi:23S rRNA (cytosine1962-C5)-methyltransferase